MVTKTNKAEIKRLPKGQRTHTRRMKQTTRNEAGMNNPQSAPARPVQVQKKQDQSE